MKRTYIRAPKPRTAARTGAGFSARRARSTGSGMTPSRYALTNSGARIAESDASALAGLAQYLRARFKLRSSTTPRGLS